MIRKAVIIVSGPPCTGKSTIAEKISKKFKLPLVQKDRFKELIFDYLGWSDREWSKKVSGVSNELIFIFLNELAGSGSSVVIESNFKAETVTPRLKGFLKKFDYLPIQVMCESDGRVCLERFKNRWNKGKRHPGHIDNVTISELEDLLLKGKSEPLDIGGEVLIFDTTNISDTDSDNLLIKVKEILG